MNKILYVLFLSSLGFVAQLYSKHQTGLTIATPIYAQLTAPSNFKKLVLPYPKESKISRHNDDKMKLLSGKPSGKADDCDAPQGN